MITRTPARRHRTIWLIAVLPALTGCIDLVPVAPPPDRPATLTLTLRLSDVTGTTGTGALVVVSAVLDPGVDAIGRDRRIENDTMTVLGEPLTPVEVGMGLWGYADDLTLERDRLANPFDVRLPRIEGLTPVVVEVRWPLLERGQPIPASVAPGADLVLPLEFSGFPGRPAPSAQRWSVAVFHGGGWFSQGADGSPPQPIVVPGELLVAAGENLLAVVNMSTSTGSSTDQGQYLARLELSQELRWNVSVTGND